MSIGVWVYGYIDTMIDRDTLVHRDIDIQRYSDIYSNTDISTSVDCKMVVWQVKLRNK